MTYYWDPLWRAPEDADNAEYVGAIRAMIMASVNWMADHPTSDPQWQEVDRRAMAMDAGAPDTIRDADIVLIMDRDRVYRAVSKDAEEWFARIDAACQARTGDQPSAHMFSKALAAGILFRKVGWDEFAAFMLGPDPTDPRH